jgi:hypothetical protein
MNMIVALKMLILASILLLQTGCGNLRWNPKPTDEIKEDFYGARL